MDRLKYYTDNIKSYQFFGILIHLSNDLKKKKKKKKKLQMKISELIKKATMIILLKKEEEETERDPIFLYKQYTQGKPIKERLKCCVD